MKVKFSHLVVIGSSLVACVAIFLGFIYFGASHTPLSLSIQPHQASVETLPSLHIKSNEIPSTPISVISPPSIPAEVEISSPVAPISLSELPPVTSTNPAEIASSENVKPPRFKPDELEEIDQAEIQPLVIAHGDHQAEVNLEEPVNIETEMLQIMGQLQLTDLGQKLFKSINPRLLNEEAYFNECPLESSGCYILSQDSFFVLRKGQGVMWDNQIKIVTIHEFLHAYWFYIEKNDSEKYTEVLELTKKYYDDNYSMLRATFLKPYIEANEDKETLIAETYAFAGSENRKSTLRS